MKKLILILFGMFFLMGISAYNYQVIYNPYTGKLDFHITSNLTGENITAKDLYLTGNMTISGNYICNDSNCFTFEELNATGEGIGGNESWNESYGRDIFVENASNLTIGDKVTFRFGEIIDNLIDGLIRITGNLNVTGGLTVSGNITADWFNGKFNWTSADDWNIFSGSTLYFNESKLETTYYNATQSQIISGVLDGGTLTDTQHQDGIYDGKTFNFSEQAGSPGLDIRINFTDIESFNQGVMRYKTSSLAGSYPIIMMWNYDLGIWEDYPPITETEISDGVHVFATITQPVFDATDHVSGGVAQMRIYKSSNGNTNNHYYVDWIAVSKGYGTPSGEEIDPYSWHRNNPSESGNFTTTGWVKTQYLNVTNTSYFDTLSNIGELIMDGLITSQNITPITDNLYSIGNSSNWFKEIFAKTIYGENINTTNLNASNIVSNKINTGNINSTIMNTTNMTIAGYKMYKDEDGDLNINLD